MGLKLKELLKTIREEQLVAVKDTMGRTIFEIPAGIMLENKSEYLNEPILKMEHKKTSNFGAEGEPIIKIEIYVDID